MPLCAASDLEKYPSHVHQVTSENPVHKVFVASQIQDIAALLQSAMTEAGPASKQSRMVLIGALASHLSGQQLRAYLPEIIAEIILCTKEVNEKARAAAFACLVDIGMWCGRTIVSFPV